MDDAFLDRRRTPRVAVGNGHQVGTPLALTVRLVDISASGVLISSPQRLAIGQRARLRTTLGARPLNVEVEVRRVADHPGEGNGRGRFRLGASFVQPDDAARECVHQFLRDDAQ
jgi:hypothetical protein